VDGGEAAEDLADTGKRDGHECGPSPVPMRR
jgi:hypothetical protein